MLWNESFGLNMSNTIELFDREIVKVSKSRHMTAIRASGMVPFVLYGPGLEKKVHGKVKMMDVQKAIRAGGQNKNAFYDIEGMSLKGKKMMIKDIQRDPVKRTPLHFDFYIPEAGAKSEYEIAILVTGQEKSAAVKAGSSLNVALSDLKVVCSPLDIPEHIEIDITDIKVGDTISIADIKATYPKITFLNDDDDVIVKMAEAKGATTAEDEAADAPAAEGASEEDTEEKEKK